MENINTEAIYYHDGKPYRIVDCDTKIKIGPVWIPMVRYEALYDNKDGKIWNRLIYDFLKFFTTTPPDTLV